MYALPNARESAGWPTMEHNLFGHRTVQNNSLSEPLSHVCGCHLNLEFENDVAKDWFIQISKTEASSKSCRRVVYDPLDLLLLPVAEDIH